MYPAHTQLVAEWSSPSIGDQRATGCPPPFLTTSVFSDKDFLDWARPPLLLTESKKKTLFMPPLI